MKQCPDSVKGLISGTTGLTSDQMAELRAFSKDRFVFYAPNFSIGVMAMIKAVEEIAPLLSDWEASLVETHHVHKKDKPSGTAKWILDAIQQHGGPKQVDVQAFRQGELSGRHCLTFGRGRESLEVTHVAEDRQVFIDGVFRIMDWVKSSELISQPGFYTMADYFQAMQAWAVPPSK